MIKNTLLLLLLFLVLSCETTNKNKALIYIKNNWEVEGLALSKSTIKEFEHFAKSKKISFTKDSLNSFENSTDHTFVYSNDSLGFSFSFKKDKENEGIIFTDYKILKFDYVKFEKGFGATISDELLRANFVVDQNLYKAVSNKNTALLGVVQKNAITYEVKVLNVYQN